MAGLQKRWLFILSPPRSGSTLLSVILGAHPQIAAPPELHLLRYDDFDSWRRHSPRAIASLCALLEMLGEPCEISQVEARYRGRATLEIYRELLRCEGAPRILVDKTPAYTAYDERIARTAELEPNYLWLIRHPLAVAHSHVERSRSKRSERQPGQSLPRHLWLRAGRTLRAWMGRELARELRRWRESHSRVERFLRTIPESRKAVLHYETLVKQPESTMVHLTQALGVGFDPSMLSPQDNLPSNLQWGLGDEKLLERSGIDHASIERWREVYSDADLDPATRELMVRFGVV